MSLFKYEVFVEVAQNGSLSRAAEKLNQTVPGVSYTISKLEDELGIPLLIRSRSKIKLTEDAERLLPHMIAVLNVNKRLNREADAIKTQNAGTVNVGSITAVARRWLPALMHDFKDAYPDIEVNFTINGYDNLFQMLLLSAVDLAVMVDPKSPDINFRPFKRDRLYAMFPNTEEYQHIMDKKQITLDELCGCALILPDWGKDEQLEPFLSGKLAGHVRYLISDADTIIAMVQNNFGVGIVSEVFLDNFPEDIIAAPIQDGPSRILGIATNSNLKLTDGTDIFIRFMTDWLAKHRISDIKDM